jgi:carbonic anhydrase
MDRLLEGYRRFRSEVWPAERARYEALATRGQSPETLVIACSDSRVDPQTVFGASPGELFVVRNVAGLVPPYQPDARYHGTSAALEYAVRVLKVARIVVLGHARCGGIKAMVEGAPTEARDFVEPWMAIAQPVLQRVPANLDGADRLNRCESEVVRLTVENLTTFPWIAESVEAGRLALHGFRFDIHTGLLTDLGRHANDEHTVRA